MLHFSSNPSPPLEEADIWWTAYGRAWKLGQRPQDPSVVVELFASVVAIVAGHDDVVEVMAASLCGLTGLRGAICRGLQRVEAVVSYCCVLAP
jgi:hypothetical protein